MMNAEVFISDVVNAKWCSRWLRWEPGLLPYFRCMSIPYLLLRLISFAIHRMGCLPSAHSSGLCVCNIYLLELELRESEDTEVISTTVLLVRQG